MDDKVLKAFLAFLIVARQKNGYVSGVAGSSILLGGKQYKFEEAGFFYQDTFYGFDPFVGQELVWAYDIGFMWAMNYYGGLIEDRGLISGKMIWQEETYKFLKKALLGSRIETPFRGPNHFSDGEWAYKNEWDVGSNISSFKGIERIYYKHASVYSGDYHGGFVKEK